MKPTRISWTVFLLLSLISAAIWLKFSYPQLSISNISIDRSEAIAIAKEYLQHERDVDPEVYKTASVFNMDKYANRYLQKTLGYEKLKTFIREHDLDLFFWKIRFFKENEKEEYQFMISSATGEITAFRHVIDNNEARKEIKRKQALEQAKAFLTETFGFDSEQYSLRGNLASILDNRTDYLFSWQKTSVNIPWSEQPNSGTGKLIINATITGDEVLEFSKIGFSVPDQFNRDLDNRTDLGRNIMTGIRIIVFLLVGSGIFFIIVRQNHLAMHSTKHFYIGIVVILFSLSILGIFNHFQSILYSYNTPLSLDAYLWRNGINTIIGALFFAVTILIPSLAGELLHYETSRQQKVGSFLHFIRSTFLSRHVSQLILLGYFVSFIMLGIQSVLVKIGQTHLGVWIEHSVIANSSTAYLPFLAAFTFGFKTSVSEELMYRFYAINLGKKIFSRFFPNKGMIGVIITVLLSSIIWGYAHSSYSIFPIWFRGLEVTFLGLFLAFIYLRFGLIPVLVGHYLFDVFWNCAGYIFGESTPIHFSTSLLILFLPLVFGLITYLINRPEKIMPLRWHLNKKQHYNLEILKTYLEAKRIVFQNKSEEFIKQEIVSHGWDPAVVEVAVQNFLNRKL